MGFVVNILAGFVSYTILNPWVLAIVLPLLILRLYMIYSTGLLAVVNRMEGKTAIITGSNTGIGFEIAHLLAARGARVILACRNMTTAQQAKSKIIQLTGNENIEVYRLDLSSLWSVRQFATEIIEREERLDVLINNAGVGALKNKKTDDDLNIMWQINHFGPFLLTNLLLGLMKKTGSGRIIFLTSFLHHFHNIDLDDLDCHKPFSPTRTYCNTKLANILTTKHLARKLEGSGITVNCVHPGIVYTSIYRRLKGPTAKILHFLHKYFGKTPEEGAATPALLAIDSRLDKVNGQYWTDCKESRCLAVAAGNLVLAERLWRKSEELVDLKEDEKHF